MFQGAVLQRQRLALLLSGALLVLLSVYLLMWLIKNQRRQLFAKEHGGPATGVGLGHGLSQGRG